jgi:hypothetical protein
MTARLLCLALALVAGSAGVQAQDYQAMSQAMEKAQAEASRPGDEKLSCDQLEEQLISVTQNPEFQAYVQAAGADAQKKQEAMKIAEGEVALQTFRTVMMAAIPGAGFPGMASAQAQANAQGASATNQMGERMEQAKKMMALMPLMMRGQRVIELATAKQCEWAESAAAPQ